MDVTSQAGQIDAAGAATAQPQPIPGLRRLVSRKVRERALGYTLLAPALIIISVFELFPIAFGFYISLCDWRLGCQAIIGADNYLRGLQDAAMWNSLLVTATYSIITVPVQLGLGFLIAVFLFQRTRGHELFRMMMFLPYITSTVASAAVWSYIYSPDSGLLNTALRAIGFSGLRWLGEPAGVFALIAQQFGMTLPGWAHGPSLALVSVSLYTTWVFIGYDITIFLAGLVNINGELYEAAKVDGARGWNLLRHITVPLMSPTIFFLLIVTVIGTFKAFNHIFVMTGGGPSDSTQTASILIFQQLYAFNRYGYAAALSFILFTVILALTLTQNYVAGRRVVYE
ncbi:MAG: sugar ABC transporter permease [Chloroflexi bacterium]|nr:sugar ABC transporter permease [Chloroflexota bacterium]